MNKKINIKTELDLVSLKWIENNLNKLQTIYVNSKKFEDFLFKKMKFENKEWFNEFKKTIKSLKNPVDKLQFIYDLYLASQGLDVEFPEGETKKPIKFKKCLKY